MASFNKVILMGNLTRDPELTYTPSQMAICKFGLAVSRKVKDREEVLFIDCTAFDKRGETIHQYCTKGKPILVEGQLRLDQWDDKTTGQKRSKIYVVIDNFQFVGSRDGAAAGGGYAGEGGEESGGGRPPAPRAAPRPAGPPAGTGRPAPQAPRPAPEQPFGDEQQFKEDDIPF